jgi:phosphate transport system substrate-binding protein
MGGRTVAVALLTAGAVLAGGAAFATLVTLVETGSTLLYPLFNLWVPDYQKTHAGVEITFHSTGSGTGIAQAISGSAQIGGSDAYLSDAQMQAYPGVLNIALTVSAQTINYNIPGLNNEHLKLSGPVLAAIYQGKAAFWDDPAIASLNPGVTLPHKKIVPIHRSDGSGDTFIFTQYLSFSAPDWARSLGYGTTLEWPAQAGIGAEGNSDMIDAAKGAPYSIAYIGISFKNATDSAGLGEALLQNKDGKFLLPDTATIGMAAQEMAGKTPPDERISMVFAAGAHSYPIVNYEYAMVKAKQPSTETAAALKDFLGWTIDSTGGNAARYMQAVGFIPLPKSIAILSRKQIDSIH